MFDFRRKLHHWMSGRQMKLKLERQGGAGHAEAARAANNHGCASDWLPPVLDPGDWSVSMFADRSATWYLDRGQA